MSEQAPIEQEATKVDPAEVERAILTDKQKEAMNRSPEDVAAAMFSMYFPVLKNVLNNKTKMTRKSLVKVMLAAVEVPLNSTEYKLLKKDEREVFSIITSLLEAKWQMMLSTLLSTQQQLIAEQEAAEAATLAGFIPEKIELSDKDRDLLLTNLENPPAPNEALKALVIDSNENEVDLKVQS